MPNRYTVKPIGQGSRRLRWLQVFGPYGGVLLALSAICLVWFGTIYFARIEKESTERSAITFEEHIIRSIRAVDQTLLYVRDSYARNPQTFDMSLWSSNSQFLTGISFQVVVIGPDGKMIASNIPGSTPGLDLSDREHFRIHKDRQTDELFVSKPVLGRVSKKWSIQFTRPIFNPEDGRFAGVAVVSVDPNYLEAFYETIDIGTHGVVSIVGTDGIVRARASNGPSKIGESMAGSSLMDAFAKAETGTYTGSGHLDGVIRIFGYRKVKDLPLIVNVGLSRSEVFAPFEASRRGDVVYASLLTVWLLAIAFLMWRYQKSLLTSRDHAEAGTRARSEFLAMMSHEIRTPLNGVIGMADVLLSSGLTAEQSRDANVMRDSAQHLLTVLNDVLDFSKLEADRMEIEKVPFNLHEAVTSSIALLHSMADGKQLALTADIAPDVPRVVRGDPARLRQVLFNLISNGLKFTSVGGVTVSVARAIHKGDDRLLVKVTDTGIGIPEDGISLLFREFAQLDRTVARRFGGTGLGLAISKRLVELMGGTIAVSSVVGKGTTFHFELPCEPAGLGAVETVAVIDAPPLTPMPCPSMRILLAEDNKTNQIVITKLMASLGLEADLVENGMDAVKACKESYYDLVLMDVMMPVMDGITACRTIRHLPEPNSKCHIIALTANAQTHDRDVCLEAGMDDFLSKPVTRAALQEKLASFRPVTRSAAEPSASAPVSATVPEPAAEKPLLDQGTLAELRDALGDSDLALVVKTFVTDTPQRFSVMRANTSDRSAIKREVHAMKSAAGSLGCLRLSDAAAALEREVLGLSDNDCLTQMQALERLYTQSEQALRDQATARAA